MKSILSILLCWYVACSAATYYVDFSSGNDANGGLSTGAAKKTIPSLSAGDTCYLKAGSVSTSGITTSSGGSVLSYGTDGTINAAGTILTSGTDTFSTDGVTTSHKVIIGGEGLRSITSVSETQLGLDPPALFTGASSLGYCVINPVTISVKSDWGSGSAEIQGTWTVTGAEALVIDGSTTNGLKFDLGAARCIYANNGSVKRGIVLKNIETSNGSCDLQQVYLRNVDYPVIDSCYIHDGGNGDDTTGDDGIGTETSVSYITVQYCTIARCGDDGMQGSPANNGFIQFCLFDTNDSFAGYSHSDALQLNGASEFHCTIRYNTFRNNANNTDWDNCHFTCYGNLFYDTIPIETDDNGNVGLRWDSGSYGEIYNNTFAYCTYYALYAYGGATGPMKIKNNVFFECKDNNGIDEGYPEIHIPTNCLTGLELDGNIYRRIEWPATGDAVIRLGGTNITLIAAQALGFETNGQYITDVGSVLFLNQTRDSLDLHTYYYTSPQVDSGVDLSAVIPSRDADWILRPQRSAWDIGAYEYTSPALSGSVTFETLTVGDIQ